MVKASSEENAQSMPLPDKQQPTAQDLDGSITVMEEGGVEFSFQTPVFQAGRKVASESPQSRQIDRDEALPGRIVTPTKKSPIKSKPPRIKEGVYVRMEGPPSGALQQGGGRGEKSFDKGPGCIYEVLNVILGDLCLFPEQAEATKPMKSTKLNGSQAVTIPVRDESTVAKMTTDVMPQSSLDYKWYAKTFEPEMAMCAKAEKERRLAEPQKG